MRRGCRLASSVALSTLCGAIVFVMSPAAFAGGETDGACCLDDASCIMTDPADCWQRKGEFLGSVVQCPSGQCLGPCCVSDTCIDAASRADCIGQGGFYMGTGKRCNVATCSGACSSDADCADGNPCNGEEYCWDKGLVCIPGQPTCLDHNPCTIDVCNLETGCVHTQADRPDCGACCREDAPCVPMPDSEVWCPVNYHQGAGTTCDDGICDGPCCLNSTTCVELERYECDEQQGWFGGIGQTCDDVDCAPMGACCFPNLCLTLAQSMCNQREGQFTGAGTHCADADICDGACCLGGECVDVAYSECAGLSGRWAWTADCDPCSCFEYGACCTQRGGCILESKEYCTATWGWNGTYLGGPCAPHSCSCDSDDDCQDGNADNGAELCDAGFCRGLGALDYTSFVACLGGPEVALDAACWCADKTGDNHADLADAAALFSSLAD